MARLSSTKEVGMIITTTITMCRRFMRTAAGRWRWDGPAGGHRWEVAGAMRRQAGMRQQAGTPRRAGTGDTDKRGVMEAEKMRKRIAP
jgi:hypothetical protein